MWKTNDLYSKYFHALLPGLHTVLCPFVNTVTSPVATCSSFVRFSQSDNVALFTPCKFAAFLTDILSRRTERTACFIFETWIPGFFRLYERTILPKTTKYRWKKTIYDRLDWRYSCQTRLEDIDSKYTLSGLAPYDFVRFSPAPSCDISCGGNFVFIRFRQIDSLARFYTSQTWIPYSPIVFLTQFGRESPKILKFLIFTFHKKNQ